MSVVLEMSRERHFLTHPEQRPFHVEVHLVIVETHDTNKAFESSDLNID